MLQASHWSPYRTLLAGSSSSVSVVFISSYVLPGSAFWSLLLFGFPGYIHKHSIFPSCVHTCAPTFPYVLYGKGQPQEPRPKTNDSMVSPNPVVMVMINGQEVPYLIDTGSKVSTMEYDFYTLTQWLPLKANNLLTV